MHVTTLEAYAQTLPAKGTDNTLDVATWNIEWFGGKLGPSNDELQFRNVLSIIRQADIDLWAVQEIASMDYFGRLLDSLGTDYSAYTDESGGQRLGFIFKPAVLAVTAVGNVLTSFDHDFGTRPPLQLSATTSTDPERSVTFITVHMKAEDGDPESVARREQAGRRIKNHIDFTNLATEMVVVLGDFNDTLTGSISSSTNTSPYANFIADGSNYLFLTGDLEADDRYTYCGSSCTSGSVIDHILITNELFNRYVTGSVDHYDEVLSEVFNFLNTTSDHLPVFASFQLNTQTATEHTEIFPQAISIYPNPASQSFVVETGDSADRPLSTNVFDVSGRLIWTSSWSEMARGGRLTVQTDGWPRGLYIVELLIPEAREYRKVVVY